MIDSDSISPLLALISPKHFVHYIPSCHHFAVPPASTLIPQTVPQNNLHYGLSLMTQKFNDEAFNYQVTILTLIIERSYAITIFLEAAIKLLGWGRQEQEARLSSTPAEPGWTM